MRTRRPFLAILRKFNNFLTLTQNRSQRLQRSWIASRWRADSRWIHVQWEVDQSWVHETRLLDSVGKLRSDNIRHKVTISHVDMRYASTTFMYFVIVSDPALVHIRHRQPLLIPRGRSWLLLCESVLDFHPMHPESCSNLHHFLLGECTSSVANKCNHFDRVHTVRSFDCWLHCVDLWSWVGVLGRCIDCRHCHTPDTLRIPAMGWCNKVGTGTLPHLHCVFHR